jgi:hypothetical protein
MAGIRMYQEQLPILYPHSFAAIQKLVMAMADFEKNIGKRSWFGRDKGAIAYEQFLNSLRQTVTCMTLDCKIRESSSVTEVVAALEELLTKFSMAYPNWEDAYTFANHFFSANNREDYTAVINRIRSRGDSPPPDDRSRSYGHAVNEEQPTSRSRDGRAQNKANGASNRDPFSSDGPHRTGSDNDIKSIISCPKCAQRIRVPAGLLLDISCPKCENKFRKFT